MGIGPLLLRVIWSSRLGSVSSRILFTSLSGFEVALPAEITENLKPAEQKPAILQFERYCCTICGATVLASLPANGGWWNVVC